MKKKDIINLVYKIAEKIADELNYDLVDIEYVKEFGSFFLKVYIDKLGGVTIDDCQKMSEILGDKLDKNDPIKEAYYLEVSSPGLDRPLKSDKDFKRNIDRDVEIKLYKALEDKKVYEGILKGFTEDVISILDYKNNIIDIPRDMISTVKLTIKF
jgi:ribosome maturation factor RimP